MSRTKAFLFGQTAEHQPPEEYTYPLLPPPQSTQAASASPSSTSACAAPSSCGCQPPKPTAVDTPYKALLKADLQEAEPADGISRREMLQHLLIGVAATAAVASGCSENLEKGSLNWEEYFKKNYRVMTAQERTDTVQRLERLAQMRNEKKPSIQTKNAIPGVLYGYAFNISKCKGYMDCVEACIKENNLDRKSGMQYIRMFEIEKGKFNVNLDHADGTYHHEVPAAGHVYMGTQCFQCENPPCVAVCPVGATWKEDDGIVVIDYDWCIGCRYCQSACPYWARRFNWHEPVVPNTEVNPIQHYLGNRKRKKGVMEKCTFCIQRSRDGKLPACAEACPTGARVFGNLLDPNSEIRYVLANKKVFRLKEDLGTEPKFWYFMD
ncbi:4Fe-4S dicluster domain-containing protein [Myxococcota bacterium]|nr:4Fe-4S dicluster domain-containing protein [Myxococcota bacterium]